MTPRLILPLLAGISLTVACDKEPEGKQPNPAPSAAPAIPGKAAAAGGDFS